MHSRAHPLSHRLTQIVSSPIHLPFFNYSSPFHLLLISCSYTHTTPLSTPAEASFTHLQRLCNQSYDVVFKNRDVIAISSDYFAGTYEWAFFVVRTGTIELCDNTLKHDSKNDSNNESRLESKHTSKNDMINAIAEEDSNRQNSNKESGVRTPEKTSPNAVEQRLDPGSAQEQGLGAVVKDGKISNITKEAIERIVKPLKTSFSAPISPSSNVSRNNTNRHANNNTIRSVSSPPLPPVNIQFRGESSYFFGMEFSIYSVENIESMGGIGGGPQNNSKSNNNHSNNINNNNNNNNKNTTNNNNVNIVNNMSNINHSGSRHTSQPNSIRGLGGNDHVLMDHINRSQSRNTSRR